MDEYCVILKNEDSVTICVYGPFKTLAIASKFVAEECRGFNCTIAPFCKVERVYD